jgi:hypothetical protein
VEWDGLSSAGSDCIHPEEEYDEFDNEHEDVWRGDVWLEVGGESDSDLESHQGDGGTEPDEDNDDDDEDWIEDDTTDGTVRVPLRTLLADHLANEARVEEEDFYRRARDDEQDEGSEHELAQYSDGAESVGQCDKDKESGREEESELEDDDDEARGESRAPVKSGCRRKKGDSGPWHECEADGCEKMYATRATMLCHKRKKHKDS